MIELVSGERMESMIRLSRETLAILAENGHDVDMRDAQRALASDLPAYSMCAGMVSPGADILANEEGPFDPYAARVRRDVENDWRTITT